MLRRNRATIKDILGNQNVGEADTSSAPTIHRADKPIFNIADPEIIRPLVGSHLDPMGGR
jgi:hypothetical protein